MALKMISTLTHWFGVLLLFISALLLLITSISAPVIPKINLLHVSLANGTLIRHSSVNFGTFGYCVMDVPPVTSVQNYCTHSHVGYHPSYPLATSTLPSFASSTSRTLTRIMVLHPIASGTAFIAFLLSFGGTNTLPSLAAAACASLAWLFTLISIAVDFSLFGVIRREVNDDARLNGTGRKAGFGAAIWCLCAAFVLLSAAVVVVIFACVVGRRERKRSAGAGAGAEGVERRKETTAGGQRKKRFGIF